MTEAEFRALAAQGHNRVPLVLETFADLDTPLSLYVKLANAPHTFLLESVVGGERFGRYSFIGLPARTRIRARGTSIEVDEGGVVVERHEGDPLAFIGEFLRRYRVAPRPGLPRFCGGLAGYFGYDTVRHIEPRLADSAPPAGEGLADIPDLQLLLTEELAVVDNLAGKILSHRLRGPGTGGRVCARAWRGCRRCAGACASRSRFRSRRAPRRRRPGASPAPSATRTPCVARRSTSPRATSCRSCCRSGSRGRSRPRRCRSTARCARSIRRRTCSTTTSADFHVVGASPEILVRKEGANITLRPIAGTRPRGASREADEKLAQELLADPKERAEHVMLVDLGRNDVGRVAQIGSVSVTEQMAIERYSHVMHIVSNVEGLLKPGLTSIDVLRASFPAGTVSGAPKVRAMEIIDELEPTRRGIYAGAVGYVSFQDDMDTAIAIRTAVVKDGMLYVQAGAGIVHDSVPEAEWTETQNKARAILRAADMVQQGLDAEA